MFDNPSDGCFQLKATLLLLQFQTRNKHKRAQSVVNTTKIHRRVTYVQSMEPINEEE